MMAVLVYAAHPHNPDLDKVLHIDTDIGAEAFQTARRRKPDHEILSVDVYPGTRQGNFKAFLRAPNGQDEVVSILAPDQLRARMLVHKKFPKHMLVGLK
jgi:hypothetical protein